MWPVLLLSSFIAPPALQRTPQRATPVVAVLSGEPSPHAKLTLVRHGQSEWNLANRFTGWVDVDLTERGITEAREASRLLAQEGEQHDMVFTSSLRRAIRTACLVLSGTNQCWLPLVKDPRLNEQHSGALTGYNKAELADQHGVEQVMKWRRTYDSPPPSIETDSPFQQSMRADERYRQVDGRGMEVPESESLQDTCARVQRVWDDTLAPALREGKNVLVVSHGNTLRALVKLVDSVSDEGSYHLDLPTACPVVYELDADLKPCSAPQGFWGISDTPRYGRFLMSESKVVAAQDAMRQQCVQNIAISTVSASGEISTCDAYTASSSSQKLVKGKDGVSFNVRERPPSYFALESERIQKKAQSEINSMIETIAAKAADPAKANDRTSNGKSAPAKGEANEVADDAPPATPLQVEAERLERRKCSLIVLRHGFSEYNAENRFTGWVDVELSAQGREEARFAGSLLKEAGVRRLEKVYASYLKRSIKTAWLMLDELEMQWVPIDYTWRLNERHYGLLQGMPKRQCSEEYGMKQVQLWRRGVRHPPPPWDTNQKLSTIDRRYAGVDVPESESLAQCTERLKPFLDEQLIPDMRAAVDAFAAEGAQGTPTFVIASSENCIRALVAELEGLSDDQVPLLDIPYATPLVYEFDIDMLPIPSSLAQAPLTRGYYLGDQGRIADVQQDIREQLACETRGGDGRGGEGCIAPIVGDEDDETCFVMDEDAEGGVRWGCGPADEEGEPQQLGGSMDEAVVSQRKQL